jgi:signal transduction histidine kinase
VMQWEVQDLPPLEWLQPPDALQVLRIVQEVLTNVLKHASATGVRLATRLEGQHVTVLIEDNGVGFDPAQVARGRGLRHLSQRAQRLGGQITLDSRPGNGTRMRLELPLQRGLPA